MSCSHPNRSKQDKEGSDAGWSGLVARGGSAGTPKNRSKALREFGPRGVGVLRLNYRI